MKARGMGQASPSKVRARRVVSMGGEMLGEKGVFFACVMHVLHAG
jgi:hypothetical protein